MKLKLSILLLFFAVTTLINAQSVTGKWKTFDDKTGDAKSIVEITEREGKIYGKVIEILNPNMKDTKCQDCSGTDKDKPVLGLEILKGLAKKGDKYTDGKILDPSSGKVYKCNVTLDKDGTLRVRGYIGFAALGRTQTWQKLK